MILQINCQLPEQDGGNGLGAIALLGFRQEFAADFRSCQGNETSDFARLGITNDIGAGNAKLLIFPRMALKPRIQRRLARIEIITLIISSASATSQLLSQSPDQRVGLQLNGLVGICKTFGIQTGLSSTGLFNRFNYKGIAMPAHHRFHFSQWISLSLLLFSLLLLKPASAAPFQTIQQNTHFQTRGTVHDIVLLPDNQHALLASAQEGVLYLDIRQPHAPVLISVASESQSAEAIVVSRDGRLAYVANGSAGLDILDLTNPQDIKLLGRMNTRSYAFNLALSPNGQTVFIADNDHGVVVADVRNPSQPRQLAVIPSGGATASVLLSRDGRTLYSAAQAGGITLTDVSQPAAPRHLSQIKPLGHAQGLALSADNRWLYAANNTGGLSIHDVSNPLQVQNVGHLDTRNAFAITLSNDGNIALVADLYNGVQVVDVSQPTHPRGLHTLKTRRAAEAVSLSRNQKILFIADAQAGLNIISFP